MLGTVGESPEWADVFREPPRGVLAPGQVRVVPRVLLAAAGGVVLGIRWEPVESVAVEQPAVTQQLSCVAQARPVTVTLGERLDLLGLRCAVVLGQHRDLAVYAGAGLGQLVWLWFW